MKRFSSKWFSKKVLISVGALVLTMAIGAYASAATSTGGSQATTETTATGQLGAPPTDTDPSGICEPGSEFGGHHGPGNRGMGDCALTDEQKTAMKERRQEHEARMQAFLDEVRAKMSTEDQVTFDGLRTTAEQQRAAVESAQEQLHDTMDRLRGLIDKYQDGSSGATGL